MRPHEPTVVVVGGGWGGAAAALEAAKHGCRAVLLEKNERMLGYGLVAGEVYQNARLTLCREARAMGAVEIFDAIDQTLRHRDAPVPGIVNTHIYEVLRIEDRIRKILEEMGVDIQTRMRFVAVHRDHEKILSLRLHNGCSIEGDAFIDATGSAGPQRFCRNYGGGCVGCQNHCAVFGGRVSVVEKAGVSEGCYVRADGTPGFYGKGVNILKASLDPGLVRDIEEKGVLVVPLPKGFPDPVPAFANGKAAGFGGHLVLVDTGFVKVKARHALPLSWLKTLPGMRHAVYVDPVGGSWANCLCFMASAPRNEALKVPHTQNLFAAGEKQGLMVGVCEAIVSGLIAGLNAARCALSQDELIPPPTTAVGQLIAFTAKRLKQPDGNASLYSCLGGPLVAHLKEKGLFDWDEKEVKRRISAAGWQHIL